MLRNYEEDVCHLSRRADVTVRGAERAGGRATTLDGETREGGCRRYSKYSGKRRAYNGTNDPPSDATHSKRIPVAN